MNKQQLISKISEVTGLTKKDSDKAVTAVFEVIEETLAKFEKVSLVGFGSFEVRDRNEREGFNPQTKEKMTIPASKYPAFKAGKNLKDAVKNS